jgi:hypothetical protein
MRSASRVIAGLGLAVIVAVPSAAGPGQVASVLPASATARSPLRSDCRDGPETARKFLNSEVEPQVAVDPTDPAQIAVAYQQDRWADGGARGVVTAISRDGGVTWKHIRRTKSSFCTGGRRRNGGDFQRATDPWVTFAPNGNLFLMTLSLNGRNPDHAMLAMKFNEAEQRWRNPRTLIREDDPDFLNDKNALTADPNETDGSHVYGVWDRVGLKTGRSSGNIEPRFGLEGPVYFARTIVGGRRWQSARVIFDPGGFAQTLGNQIVVSPDLNDSVNEGQLIDSFALINPFRETTSLSLIRSFDQGTNWSSPIRVNRIFSRGTVDPDRDADNRDAIRTGDRLPDMAVDRGTGMLYVVWQDNRFNNNEYDGILFSQSADGGATWSEPIEINKTLDVPDPLNRQAFTPTVTVTGQGTIAVAYYDFRNNNVNQASALETDYWIVHCHPLGAGCTNPTAWEETGPIGSSFDMKFAPYARGYFVGDYVGLEAVGANQVIAIFSRAMSSSDPATVHAALVTLP